ncbi:MAG: hypothetical protein KC994_24025, partial [Candidatus Omnitrophica bacterium]|nr:hypothetical protein [Candidatus Omnitrophota bacterium]
KNGFASLGLGEKVTDDQLLATVKSIDANPKLRVEMRNRMAETDLGGGAYRVTQLILNAYRESNLKKSQTQSIGNE